MQTHMMISYRHRDSDSMLIMLNKLYPYGEFRISSLLILQFPFQFILAYLSFNSCSRSSRSPADALRFISIRLIFVVMAPAARERLAFMASGVDNNLCGIFCSKKSSFPSGHFLRPHCRKNLKYSFHIIMMNQVLFRSSIKLHIIIPQKAINSITIIHLTLLSLPPNSGIFSIVNLALLRFRLALSVRSFAYDTTLS
jgi:hypothetical protein